MNFITINKFGFSVGADTGPRRSVIGRIYDFIFGSRIDTTLTNLQSSLSALEQQVDNSSVVLDTKLQSSLSTLEQQVDDFSVFLANFQLKLINMNCVQIRSNEIDTDLHHISFEQEIANNYQCIHPTDSNLRRCVVTNYYYPLEFCQATHILAVSQCHKLQMIRMHPSEVWNWRNGLCLHKEIDKRLKALDLVFKYDNLTDTFRVQLLYDDLFVRLIRGITKGQLNHTSDTTPATFGDINGRELSLPPNVQPFRKVVWFIAYSAYRLALTHPNRAHKIATETSHTIQEWAEVFGSSHSDVHNESPAMTRWLANSDT